MIVRENTEGLYSGIEEIDTDRATTLRVVTGLAQRGSRVLQYGWQKSGMTV